MAVAPFVILTGASGSGKTTIAERIATRFADAVAVHRFDQVGVPSAEVMVAQWGSGEGWQRARTMDWMARIAAVPNPGRPVLFEGQMQLAFIQEALLAAGIDRAHMILVDCHDEIRRHRLVHNRQQPDLANARMMNWAAFLRREAAEQGCEVLDTGVLSLASSVALVCQRLRSG